MNYTKYLKEREDFSWITKPYSGQEIAKELGISRQAVSNTLKRGMKKIYQAVKKENKLSPIETAEAMMYAFGLAYGDESEIQKFYKLFPPDVRKEIEQDAMR